MPSKPNKAAVGALRLILAGTFLIKALPKLTASPDVISQFERFRYPDWFRIAVGLVEIIAAVLLLAPRTAGYAITALAAVMVGATFTLINAGDFRQSLVPMVVLGMLAYVAFNSRDL